METIKKLRVLSICMLVTIGGFIAVDEFAYAQDEVPVEDPNTEQSIIIVLLGIGAGALLAYQGYRTTAEDWDSLKFFDGLIMSVLGSVPLAIGAAITSTELNIFGYVLIFFSALGLGQQFLASRKKTIPSNTTK